MTEKLAGKKALITGGNRGLGKAMALSLAKAGATVVLVARDEEALAQTAAEINEAGGRTLAYAVDVTSEESVAGVEPKIRQEIGLIDILINNAGINIRKPITEFHLEEWNRVLNTNLTSAFLMCRMFVPHLRGKGYGRIINMTSMMSHISLPGRTAYSASKAGLLGLTKSLALELAEDHITVNGISPGPFATEMNSPLIQNPEINQQFISKIPVGRWGKVEEIGELVVYLCSPDAGFITGTDIVIDGGWTAQ